ncbi:MAG: hypothetical protein AAF570_23730, partial [Bacteroidota bacterium]
MSLFFQPAGAQNSCASAVTLTGNSACTSGSTIGAPDSGPDDCDCCCFLGIGAGNLCLRDANAQWYRYVSTSTAAIRIELDVTSSGSNTDIGFTVWTVGCGSVAPNNEFDCVDANGDGQDEELDITSGVSNGTTYLIRVSGDGTSDQANYCIKVLQSADEPCDAPTQAIQNGCSNTLDVVRYNVSGSSQTFSGGSTSCGLDGDDDVFFRVNAPASGTFTMFVNDWGDYNILTSADMTANIYEGANCNSLSIAGPPETVDGNSGMNNPASPGCIDISQGIFNDVNNGPFIFDNLTPGQDYYVRITEQDDQSASDAQVDPSTAPRSFVHFS